MDLQAPKKKIYMLFDLEPDRSLTGGAWYSDQDFEKEFIQVLTSLCKCALDNLLLLSTVGPNHRLPCP